MIYHEHRKQHRYKDKDEFCLSEASLWILFDWWLYFQYRRPHIDCYSYQDWEKIHACKNCVVYRCRLRHIIAGTLRNPFLDLMNIIVRLAISVQRQIRIVINRLNFEDSGICLFMFWYHIGVPVMIAISITLGFKYDSNLGFERVNISLLVTLGSKYMFNPDYKRVLIWMQWLNCRRRSLWRRSLWRYLKNLSDCSHICSLT